MVELGNGRVTSSDRRAVFLTKSSGMALMVAASLAVVRVNGRRGRRGDGESGEKQDCAGFPYAGTSRVRFKGSVSAPRGAPLAERVKVAEGRGICKQTTHMAGVLSDPLRGWGICRTQWANTRLAAGCGLTNPLKYSHLPGGTAFVTGVGIRPSVARACGCQPDPNPAAMIRRRIP
ncbi:glutamate synthase [Thiohalobacter thiocyanaticus]|uniref:Glutamate synthase n=1 Tax=Thiohalobacter thiocyanaticus TaxID=585455 RepID=A0A1Z4VNE2_9GAMM|nr:glutamate synthase [Thiohalobacter thiocyanaticus]